MGGESPGIFAKEVKSEMAKGRANQRHTMVHRSQAPFPTAQILKRRSYRNWELSRLQAAQSVGIRKTRRWPTRWISSGKRLGGSAPPLTCKISRLPPNNWRQADGRPDSPRRASICHSLTDCILRTGDTICGPGLGAVSLWPGWPAPRWSWSIFRPGCCRHSYSSHRSTPFQTL
jgi:hypothetical protein